jgi:cytochrome c-type biogenesis protein
LSPDAWFTVFYAEAMGWINLVDQGVRALPVSYAFGAGMLATLNPCGFVMLPAFAAFYTSAAGGDPGAGAPMRAARALRMGALTTIAFVGTFGLMGFVVTAGGQFVMDWAAWAGIVVGVLLAGFGTYQLISRRSLFARVTAGVRAPRSVSTRGVLLFGFAYAICSLGCTLPIFLVVVGGVFLGRGDFSESIMRFVQYGAGMGLVLTLVTLGVALARGWALQTTRHLLRYVDPMANAMLLIAGVYIIWYWSTIGSQP